MKHTPFNESDEYRSALADRGRSASIGLPAGTIIQTDKGPCRIESINLETQVSIFPERFARPISIERRTLYPNAQACALNELPVKIPAFTIGNFSDLVVCQEMKVLLADYELTEFVGTPYVMMNAGALYGYWNIDCVRPEEQDFYTLGFEEDVAINVDGHAYLCIPGTYNNSEPDENGYHTVGGEKVINLVGEQVDAYIASLN